MFVQVRLGFVRSVYVRLFQVRLGKFRLVFVISC
jgi:hypothetical protein